MKAFNMEPGFASNDRRNFFKTSGQLVIGFMILEFPFCTSKLKTPLSKPVEASPPSRPSSGAKAIDSWIRLDTNGHVTVLTGKMELGQGVKTALMQIAAEELDVEMSRVRIITADTAQTPNERYTAGSASIESSGRSIRNAAAEARKRLLELASKKLNVPVAELTVENGNIKSATGPTATYWELLSGQYIEGEVTGNAPLKAPSSYRIIGSAQPREDIIAIATGAPYYIHDMRLPDMVHGRILRPPAYEAKLLELPSEKLSTITGVLKLVQNGSFVGVITSEEFQAVKSLQVLRDHSKWDRKSFAPLPKDIFEDMLKTSARAETIVDNDLVETSIANASMHHEAVYQRPYQMHASIGPSCAIALWEKELLTIWSHTQGVFPLRQTVSNMLSLPEEKIRVIGVPGAGCYGHNGADDVAADAALLAMEMEGRPVRVQWMREDEHRWEPYGSAMMMKLKAGVSTDGRVVAWKTDLWSDTHSTRPGGRAGHFIAARDLEKPFDFSSGGFSGGSVRNSEPLYDFGPRQILLHNYKGPLRTSALRSLGAYANIFALESFVDELALKAGKDPVEFRLLHLKNDRARAVIGKLAEKVGWHQRKKITGQGIGFAFAQYKNNAAYFAVVAEVNVDEASRLFKVTKLTGCIDAGQTINSDGITNQTSGGMIQSASWTLLEEVQYDGQGIISSNWDTYPILRFLDVPETEVIIIDRPELDPLGAGEAAQGPTAAAIANGVFYATGRRIRELPITTDKLFRQG